MITAGIDSGEVEKSLRLKALGLQAGHSYGILDTQSFVALENLTGRKDEVVYQKGAKIQLV